MGCSGSVGIFAGSADVKSASEFFMGFSSMCGPTQPPSEEIITDSDTRSR
jgi:hypothetical protein